VRELADALPDGWPIVMDAEVRFEVAYALGLALSHPLK
jgi:hypothetical protein